MSGLAGLAAGVVAYWVAKETERPWPVVWALVVGVAVAVVVYELTGAG